MQPCQKLFFILLTDQTLAEKPIKIFNENAYKRWRASEVYVY